ncbi:MAG: hypothetical protein ACLFWL_13980 [Candidatus Brocadiia bacterium]
MREARTIYVVLISLLFFVGSIGISRELQGYRKERPSFRQKVTHIPMGGFETVTADVLWMRLVQYMGSPSQDQRHQYVSRVAGQLDSITRLDPRFRIVYDHGVLFLAVNKPAEALDLVDRALEHIPGGEYGWRLPFYGAFISYRYWDHPDRYKRSLQYMKKLESIPDAPVFAKRFRARILEKKQDYDSAFLVWQKLFLAAQNPHDLSIAWKGMRRAAAEVAGGTADKELRKKALSILEKGKVTPEPEIISGEKQGQDLGQNK